MSPKDRVALACKRFGEGEVASRCASVLAGGPPEWLLKELGGEHAEAIAEKRLEPKYWPRVWAARALLYVWTPTAAPAVVSALEDPAWRVREMALKVIRLRELGEAAERAAVLTGDETERVRKAAVRALARIGEAEHAESVRDMLDDPFVAHDAERALAELGRRLDRPI